MQKIALLFILAYNNMSHLIKVYHSFDEGKKSFEEFLDDISKTLSKKHFTLGIHYSK
jgi:hypothetical protein